ncbi:MAG: type II secretion system F family protein [Coriobacteriales bacterium]|jgi:tight adherence protein C|nr:type II secretion system F family protein [Coriobacteriales bacterium]
MTFVITLFFATAVTLLSYEFFKRLASKHQRDKGRQKLLAHATALERAQVSANAPRGSTVEVTDHKKAVERRVFHSTGNAARNEPENFEKTLGRLPFVGGILSVRFRKRRSRAFCACCERELPRMLEIVALAIRAGLSFDAAFGLYVRRFDTVLARYCRERFEVWERGLISREDGLRALSAGLDVALFKRFTTTVIRALAYGAPMAPLLRDYAEEARKVYRDKQREKVAKAPVKMLIPTGTLILPAMLMLVIGPIVLDITERMV